MQPQDLATVFAAVVTAVGVVIAVLQMRHGVAVEKAQFVAQTLRELLDNNELRRFFYKIDYEKFQFDPQNVSAFKGTEDERLLDEILFKLNFVAGLVRRKVLKPTDIEFVMFGIVQVFRNPSVLAYIAWVDAQYVKHGRHGEKIRARPHDDARLLLEQMK